jgi:hypothetical protein
VRLGGDGDDQVERAADEVRELQLDDRPLALPRRADRGSDEALLRDRRVEDALVAELLPQPLRDAERAAEVADVLAEQEDALVLTQRVAKRRLDRLQVCDLAGYACASSVGAASATGVSGPGTAWPSRATTRPPSTRAG